MLTIFFLKFDKKNKSMSKIIGWTKEYVQYQKKKMKGLYKKEIKIRREVCIIYFKVNFINSLSCLV